MTLPFRFLKFSVVFLSLLSAQGIASGQSLYDVVISISDRQRVINQRDQVGIYLSSQNNDPADTDTDLPADLPIEWMEVGANPTQSAVDGLEIGERIGLLNQAVAEFERLKFGFLNSSPGEFETGGIVGKLQFYTSGDFESLPRATPENYHELLRLLAQRVRTLRLLQWSVAFRQRSFTDKTSVWEKVAYRDPQDSNHDDNREPFIKIVTPEGTTPPASVTWAPDSIGSGNLKVEISDPLTAVTSWYTSQVEVQGSYSESPSLVDEIVAPLRRQDFQLSGSYPEEARVSATAPGGDGTQIPGTVYLLRRSTWHQIDIAGASSKYEKNEAGYIVDGSSASGTIALFGSPPSATVNGSWITTWESSNEDGDSIFQTFVEGGYQHKEASILPLDDEGYSDDYSDSYEKNWKIGCVFYSVFKPTFTRGVDATTMRSKLESADLVLAQNSADGNLLLHPRPSLLCGIELGPGLKGGGNGYISAGAMEGGNGGYSEYSNWYWHEWKSMLRFDSSYSLHFAGSHSEYHVVYENTRSARSQRLPTDSIGWPYIETDHIGSPYENPEQFGSHETTTLYDAWDSPRLKQVAGRDLVADITYDTNHYGGYTVRIYRRSTGSTTPTPGKAMNLSGMTLIRTWAFSRAGGLAPHPTVPEKLEVAGSGGEKYEIQANQVPANQGLKGAYWHYDSLTWWWWKEGTHSWTLKLLQGTTEKFRKDIEIITSIDEYEAAESAVVIRESLDGESVSTLSSATLDPFSGQLPRDWTITSAEKTITGSASSTYLNGATRYGVLPSSISIQYDGIQPNATYTWDSNGLLATAAQGPWTTTGTASGDTCTLTQKFNGGTFTTTATQFSDGGNKVKTSTTTAGETAWSEVEYGTSSNGLPGLPLLVKNSDGTGTTFGWNASSDGSYVLTAEDGLLSGSTVSRGTRQLQSTNARGFPTQSESFAINGGTLKTDGTAFTTPTAWGMPKKSTDYRTGLNSTWNYDANLSRLSSHSGYLGIASELSGYDVLGRPGTVSSNGISATNTYTAFSTSSTISGGASGSIANNRDTLGRATSSNTTWNGVTDNLAVAYGTSSDVVTRNQSLLGTHQATLRKDDGTTASSSGPTLPFGGNNGTGLTIDNGLFKTTSQLADQSAAFQTTWTDAWGRIHKTTTAKGTTELLYSAPDSSLKRAVTVETSGRRLITESDPYNAAGSIRRSGIDVNQNGTLGASDRYVESITTVSGSSLVTVIKRTEDSGLREILRTTWTPAGNITVTKINGNEETITRTPNYTNKTINTSSTKGWSRTEAFNSLGLVDNGGLSGAGIPGTDLTPTWRADGSLENVSITIGGKTHSASFNNNGTLASLTAPGKGNILDGHGISNGVETLGVDGVSVTRKLDGTEESTSGGDVIGKTEELATSGSGFKHTTTPAVGAATEVVLNAAGAPTAKNYAAGAGEAYTSYPGGLLHTITLACGGSVTFGYSNDGAKDLTSATWPAVSSGTLANTAITEGYGYDRAGRMDEIGDSSGVRGLVYQNGALRETAWNSGQLAGYRIVRGVDAYGRDTGFELYRGNTLVHSAVKAPNGVSGEISGISSGAFNATFGRDAERNLTSITRGSVIQNWPRNAGRITAASSSVTGAPSFAYTEFDAKGRRKKCTTAGAAWTYTYTNGQLTSATHPTLGNFTYQFDAIGRRTENSTNTADLLNRTLAWTNTQNKTVKINAHPDARVWFNGTEIPSFTGSYHYPVPSPGASGGWVPWHTLAVLEGEGDAGANSDAKAEHSGAVWVPPISESFTYDAAGNRESSAQWDFGWNAKNELARARTKNHKIALQGYDITNAYDAEGRRFSKKINRYQSGQIVEQKVITFLHDGNDLIYERHQLPSGLTILERKYVWGPDLAAGAGGLLLIRETIGNVTTDLYPLYDGTGHVVALADSTGTLQAEYAYGPFGEPIYAIGPKPSSCPFRFQTKYLDEETGLYNFGRRFLDPITGQWLSREPLGESESLNLYSLTGNDPINRLDAQGLAAIDISKDLSTLQTQLAEAMAILAKVGSTTVPISDEALESLYATFLEKYTAYLTGVSKLQAKVTANEVSGNGMMEGWWHRDALSQNRASAFGMQMVPDDDFVTGLLPIDVLSNSLDRSRQFSEIISSKYQSDAEFAEVIATELEKRQREVNYATAALGVGAIVNTAGRIAITEGGGATIGYLTKVAGGYAISYAGAAATEFGIDQAQKNGLVTANQANATRMGIALFQIVVAKRQMRAEARAAKGDQPVYSGAYHPESGNGIMRPSSYNSPLREGWVSAKGGHASVGAELSIEKGVMLDDLRGFTAFDRGSHWEVEFKSALNSPDLIPGTVLPPNLRAPILESIERATGKSAFGTNNH